MEEATDAMRVRGERIAALLEEARAACGPHTWPSVERLLEAILQLQGEALVRIVARAPPDLLGALLEDELCASLLRLHGLHPEPVERRIARALEQIRPRLVGQVRGLDLVEVDPSGCAVVAVLLREGRFDPKAVEAQIQEAVLEEAPELAEVRVVDERLRRAALGMAVLEVHR